MWIQARVRSLEQTHGLTRGNWTENLLMVHWTQTKVCARASMRVSGCVHVYSQAYVYKYILLCRVEQRRALAWESMLSGARCAGACPGMAWKYVDVERRHDLWLIANQVASCCRRDKNCFNRKLTIKTLNLSDSFTLNRLKANTRQQPSVLYPPKNLYSL